MGLDSNGLTIKRHAEIVEDIEAKQRAAFGEDINTSSSSVLGQLNNIFAAALSEVWELGQGLYDGFNPDAASGVMLDNAAALVGVTRKPASYTTGVVTIDGVQGTEVAAGKLVQNPTTGDTFVLVETVTIPPSGSIDVQVRAEEAGALVAKAGEVSEVVTPVGGWQGVTNAADFVTGSDVEGDTELRLRRESSLPIIGAATDVALAARLVDQVDSVQAAVVVSNRSLVVDGDGRPPKSFEAVIWPDSGVDEGAVTNVVFENMPAGIETAGVELFTVEDEFGQLHSVRWSYATRLELFVEVDITTTAGFPSDGADQVAAAILAVGEGVEESDTLSPQQLALRQVVGDGLGVGEDVLILRLVCAAATVPGVKGVVVRVEDINPPANTADIAVAATEIAVLDSARITVNV